MSESKLTGRSYVLGWVALLLLTGLSYLASLVPMGPLGPVVALGIALVKVAVVGLVFMHLVEARFSTQMVAVLNLVFVALLCLGIAGDVAFR